MKDSEKLDLQDLDSVTGGLDFDQLTPAELSFYMKLDRRLNKANVDYANGKISEEKLNDIRSDFLAYKNILEATYQS